MLVVETWAPLLMCGALLHLWSHSLAAQPAEWLDGAIGSATVAIADPDLAQPLSYAFYADGSIAVIELQGSYVTRYASDGSRLWRVGRPGAGPGEFRVPYRLALDPRSEELLVFDVGTGLVTRVARDGRVVGTARPDLRLTANAVLVSPSGEVIMSGITTDPRGRGMAIHVFSSALRHVRSFAPLSAELDPAVMRSVGPGYLHATDAPGFAHTSLWPYQVIEYSWDGRERTRFRAALSIDDPSSWIRYVERNGRRVVETNQQAVRPLAILPLGDSRYLAGTFGPRTEYALLDSSGRVAVRGEVPAGWGSIGAYNLRRRELYIYGEVRDEPVILRAPVRRP